jgi:hypothetical protein
VANVVEKDLKQMKSGAATRVQVDAFPGETFKGRIARVSPVLDPATRTAPIEIEIPNGDFRLKPGMYARVGITTDVKKDALVVPVNAVVDLGGRRGVFQPQGDSAVFHSVQVGAEEKNVVEIVGGISEGDYVITTGAGALRDGDRVVVPGRSGGGRGRRGGDTAAADDGPSQGTGQPSGFRQGGERQGDASSRENATGSKGAARDSATGRDSSAGREGRQFTGGDSGRRYGGDGSTRSGGDGSGRRYGGDGSGRRNGGAQRPAPPSSQE